MKIGISGASGKLGQATVAELIARGGGHQLVGISRSPEGVPGAVEARQGDYDHPDTLVRAYAGLDRLLIIPSSELRHGLRGGQLRAAIDAAVKVGVKHIFLVSAVGTHEEPDPAIGAAYWAGEQHLIKTAEQWTILRMNYYAESMAEEIQMSMGQGILAGFGEEHVAYVSRKDLAAAAAGALLSEGHVGAIYNVTGPATVTGPERATIVSDIIGKPVHYVVVAEDQFRGGLVQAGLPEPIIDAFTEIKKNFVRGQFDIVTGDFERLAGRPAKTLRDVLAATLS
jgi:NAD(P)H dehydrogenase (quinone)